MTDNCPFCKKQNIIYRKWLKDFICGWCKNFFKINDGIIEHLGQRIFHNKQWKDVLNEDEV